MTWNPASPVTGATVSGLTSPTYTLSSDIAPDVNGKQVAVSALGGTQTGVTTHSVSSPFTITYNRPKQLKQLPKIGVNGQYGAIPKNTHKVIVRKGVVPAAGQPAEMLIITMTIDVPAGAETYDSANVRAAISAAVGTLSQQASGVADTLISGLL
jgi:hypothetical protein